MRPESSAASWLKFFTAAGINVEFAEHYAVTFSKNQIQLDMLPEINKDYLNDMGISLLGHVIAILRHAKLVYADEIKKSELPVVKKLDTKLSKTKDTKTQPTPVKPSRSSTKPNEEHEKPSSSVAKRKSTLVPLPAASEKTEPKIKVRKTLCDSSDDITIPKVVPVSNTQLYKDTATNDESRKGVFKRLGVEVNQPPVELKYPDLPHQTNVTNANGVFSRLGGKAESLQTAKPTASSTKHVISSRETSVVKPLVKKSIIRTRLDKPQQPLKPKIQLIKQRVVPQTYMDREILKTEKRVTSRLTNSKTTLKVISDNTDVKSRLGFSFSKTVTSQGPGNVKKVSFGTVSQKLIPKVNNFPHTVAQKFSSPSFPSSTKFTTNGRPSGVFGRLGTVPQ